MIEQVGQMYNYTIFNAEKCLVTTSGVDPTTYGIVVCGLGFAALIFYVLMLIVSSENLKYKRFLGKNNLLNKYYDWKRDKD